MDAEKAIIKWNSITVNNSVCRAEELESQVA